MVTSRASKVARSPVIVVAAPLVDAGVGAVGGAAPLVGGPAVGVGAGGMDALQLPREMVPFELTLFAAYLRNLKGPTSPVPLHVLTLASGLMLVQSPTPQPTIG